MNNVHYLDNIMTDISGKELTTNRQEEFGKYSWIKPALVMGASGAAIVGVIMTAPYILETIQSVFMFLMFFGLLV